MVEAAHRWNEVAPILCHLRTVEEIKGFSEGLELLEPGVVSVNLRRPSDCEVGTPDEVDRYRGVARKP